MEYIKYVEIDNKQWNQYMDEIESSTFNCTTEKINFDVEYSEKMISNESIVLVVDKKPVAVSAIYVEEKENAQKAISWAGTYCMAPIVHQGFSYHLQEKYMEVMLEYIDELSKMFGCSEIMLRYDPLSNPANLNKIYNYNYLIRKGYIDRSSFTQILDLQKEEKELYSDIRKGHKSDIKKGNYDVIFFDNKNITKEVIEEYRRIYECDAGKVTRNSQMSHHYLHFVQNGKGIVGFAKKNKETVAVIIVTFYKNTAYYSSYAELTEQLNGISAGHMLQWNTILELKKREIKFYEIGEQVFGPTHYDDPDKKLIDISRFKRGFGGYTVPLFRGKNISIKKG